MLQFHDSLPTNESAARTFILHTNISGVLWREPDEARTRPLVLLAHGGGQSSTSSAIQARAERLTDRGFDAVAMDAPGHGGRPTTDATDQAIARMRASHEDPAATANAVAALNEELSRAAVPEWVQLLNELEHIGLLKPGGPVGFWGYSLGAAIGFPLIASEPRIRAAHLGLVGDSLSHVARNVTAPLQFILQWDDEIIARDSALQLFDAIGSSDKTLHANPGRHREVPQHEHASALDFLDDHLTSVTTRNSPIVEEYGIQP
jgi:pimeloyl-ACP methyl ester carboxylesterase